MTLEARLIALAQAIGADIKALLGRDMPAGGAAGQVLTKTSGTDYATVWQAPVAGSASISQAVVSLPYSAGGMSTVNVINAGVTAASKIVASLSGTVENEADDIDDWGVAATPLAGSINFNISCPGPFCGQVTVNYMIG